MKFEPLKEKKVNIKYIMNFYIFRRVIDRDIKINSGYSFLATTGKSWVHTIDYAKFTFIIPKEENLEMDKNDFEIEENETHFTLTKGYNNWNFDEDMHVSWTIYEKKSEDNQTLMNMIAIVVLIVIFIVALVFAFGYKKNS